MKFIFVCPENQRVFETKSFRVIDNQGIITDEDGNRSLDAKVVLNEPCPFCNRFHVYHVCELSCPFEG